MGEATNGLQVCARLLRKVYERGSERIDVLQGVDMDVPEGDFVALMGPSGSGKTTLLNLVGGLDRPTQGTLEVAGRKLDALSDGQLTRWRAENVGFVFQLYNLLPVLTAERNVELPLLLTHLSKKERREHVAALLGTSSSRPSGRLSVRAGRRSRWHRSWV